MDRVINNSPWEEAVSFQLSAVSLKKVSLYYFAEKLKLAAFWSLLHENDLGGAASVPARGRPETAAPPDYPFS
jgi:hypothetical protein